MADIWVSALKVVLRSEWTPEFKQQIGDSVLSALFQQIQENYRLPDVNMNDMTSKEFIKYILKPNTRSNATITVNTN